MQLYIRGWRIIVIGVLSSDDSWAIIFTKYIVFKMVTLIVASINLSSREIMSNKNVDF